MRIVLDLQGGQTGSRLRGIGRYSMSLAKAMIRNGAEHEFFVVLNGLFPETIRAVRAEFDGLIPRDNIRIWDAVGPVHALDPTNDWRRGAAELTREAFIQSLSPDIVHISSFMEGFGDNGVHSIGRAPHPFPVAVTFYDVIPLINKSIYLDTNPVFKSLYHEKLDYMEKADLLFAISESSRQEAIRYLYALPDDVINVGAAVDDKFRCVEIPEEARRKLYKKFGITRDFIMYSGATDERKNHLGLIKAYSMLSEDLRQSHQLVLVGGLPNEHKDQFRGLTRELFGERDDIVITGRVTDDELVALYNLCTLYVFPSWHEGFGLPALEAMACGAPVIGSNTTSIPEVLGREDMLFDPFSPHSIAAKMSEVLAGPEFLYELKTHGVNQARNFSWDISARKALQGMERWHQANGDHFQHIKNLVDAEFPPDWLLAKVSRLPGFDESQGDFAILQDCIAHARARSQRYLFVDVSELVQRDGRSGIQRVVRSLLQALFRHPPEGFRVMPVYATTDNLGYRYATDLWRQYHPEPWIPEGLIDFCASDVFFGLDMQHHVIPYQKPFFEVLRKYGIPVYFLIYDLLPVLAPQYFRADTYEDHRRWLGVLAEVSEGLVCISRTVSEELVTWLQENPPVRDDMLRIGWSYIGANIEQSVPDSGMPEDAEAVLEAISNNKTFLSVSTLEPRKGHGHVLDAADVLWSEGLDFCIVFVGRQGWNFEELIERIQSHAMLGRRLFWLNGVSDEYLGEIYKRSSCLVSASFGEGFGLPIVEAARHQMPIIVRDIPVFREVAGDGAVYFGGSEGSELVDVLRTWLDDFSSGQVLSSKDVGVLDWDQSAKNFLQVILGGKWSAVV